ncbi:MAG: hypothetical protein MZW92_58730 [Comamonadaceae bacterium]|nr:hypothetical protein [Comamonadaceae bacterium]
MFCQYGPRRFGEDTRLRTLGSAGTLTIVVAEQHEVGFRVRPHHRLEQAGDVVADAGRAGDEGGGVDAYRD